MINNKNLNLSLVGKTSIVISVCRTLISNTFIHSVINKNENENSVVELKLEELNLFQSYLPFYNNNPYKSDISPDISFFDPYSYFFTTSKESQELLNESLELVYYFAPNLFQSPYLVEHFKRNWEFYCQSTTSVSDVWNHLKSCPPLKGWSLVAIENIVKRIALRSLLVDELIQSDKSFKQIVILGSGLDTRLQRLPLDSNVKGFEIDLPEIISLKKIVMEYAMKVLNPISKSSNHYIGANLKKDGWIDQLKSNGFDPCVKTVWIAEGLLMYLEEEECHKLIKNCAVNSASGSAILVQTIGQVDKDKDKNFRKMISTLLQNDVRLDFLEEPDVYLRKNLFSNNITKYNDNDILYKFTKTNDKLIDDKWSQFAIGYTL